MVMVVCTACSQQRGKLLAWPGPGHGKWAQSGTALWMRPCWVFKAELQLAGLKEGSSYKWEKEGHPHGVEEGG